MGGCVGSTRLILLTIEGRRQCPLTRTQVKGLSISSSGGRMSEDANTKNKEITNQKITATNQVDDCTRCFINIQTKAKN